MEEELFRSHVRAAEFHRDVLGEEAGCFDKPLLALVSDCLDIYCLIETAEVAK